jgi:hypothetical protein
MQSSEFRIEKTRAVAQLVLATGASVSGHFFLWTNSQRHAGPDRIGDLLNERSGFFPFQLDEGETALYNREHVVLVRLPQGAGETQHEAGYEVAKRHLVTMLLSTGDRIAGKVSVYLPQGHSRLSDYARSDQTFRYVETDTHTVIVNSAHVVELREIETDDVGVR